MEYYFTRMAAFDCAVALTDSDCMRQFRMSLDAAKQAVWVIDFRVIEKPDGQPDFLEAFQCLEGRIGKKGQWHPLCDLPNFKVIKTKTGTIYAMEVLVEERLIDLLKWQDIEEDDLRVLDERLATQSESEILARVYANRQEA